MAVLDVGVEVVMARRRYEFRVAGRLSERAQHVLAELTVVEVPTETVLCGTVVDDAHLHGVLARLEDLGLRVVSMQEVRGPADHGC